eukprot:tig00020539_g10439.t1
MSREFAKKSKRARVKEPPSASAAALVPAAAAAHADADAYAPGPFDALPDVVMSDVFKALGLQASWLLRGVSRRWRRVVEETEWASVELRMNGGITSFSYWTDSTAKRPPKRTRKRRAQGDSSKQPERGGKHDYAAATALFESGKLRLCSSRSVALRAELPQVAASERSRDVAVVKRSHQLAAEAACSLLRAVVRSHSGPAQLRDVTVELLRVSGIREATESFLRRTLIGVLRALAPPKGAAACSALESLSIGMAGKEIVPSWDDMWMPWPRAADLRAALAPFGRLRFLALSFNRADRGVGPEAAAAIAAACPLLRALAFRPDSRESLAALAPLAHLEELLVAWPPSKSSLYEPDVPEGLPALADGPAGRSLRRIAFFEESGLYTGGSFPARSAEAAHALLYKFSEAATIALSRMPKLERIEPLPFPAKSPENAKALGRIEGLREAFLYVSAGFPLHALAEALAGLPRLQRLSIKFEALYPGSARPPDLLAFLGSPAVQRALVDLNLRVQHQIDASETEAIARLPRLGRLRLKFSVYRPKAPTPPSPPPPPPTPTPRRSRDRGAVSHSDPAPVVAALSSPPTRRVLTDLALDLARELSGAEARAIAALPALRSLSIVSNHLSLDPASFLPYELLRDGLGPRPDVRVGVCCYAYGASEASRVLRHMRLFKGRSGRSEEDEDEEDEEEF